MTPAVQRAAIGDRCREVWKTIAAKPLVMRRIARSELRHRFYRLTRRDNRSDPLESVCALLAEMAVAGVPEADAIALERQVQATREAVYGAEVHAPSAGDLDIEEDQTDALEDHATCQLHVRGETPERLEAGAAADEKAARVLLVRAKWRRHRAHALRYQQAR